MSDLVREISRLLHRAEHEEYTDDPVDWGRIGALNEDKLGWSQREEVRNAISILEGLL